MLLIHNTRLLLPVYSNIWSSINPMKKALFSFLLLCVSFPILAQSSLVRGPYLNSGSPESMVIRWRSTASEIGQIAFGIEVNNLTDTLTELGPHQEHEIRVSSLMPNTKYYYTIGTADTAYTANDASYYFKTSPLPGTSQPIRIWSIGDFGNGTQAQYDVKTGYTNNYGDVHTDVWMWLGDNAYGDGTTQEYQENVFEVYPEVLKNAVVWPCPGNHDYKSVDLFNNGPYYELLTLPENGEAGGVPSGEEGYYSFDYGNVHFLSLNTEYLLWIATGGTAFQSWLEQDLQNTTADWIVAFWHQPPYSKGTHDSDEFFSRPQLMRDNVLPIIEEYGVDLVLSGHSHSYERSYLINGHYGTSDTWNPSTMLIDGSNGNPNENNEYVKYYDGSDPNLGAVYAVVGSSGQKGDGSHPLNHPVMHMSTEDYHGSMIIDVHGMELNAKFIDTTGAVLDEFTILKQEAVSGTGITRYNAMDKMQLNVFPNPFKETFNIEFTLAEYEEVELSILDVKGKVVEVFGKKGYQAGEHRISYSPTIVPTNGIYIVELKTASKLSVKRLVRME